jgi:ribosomal protein L34
MVEDVLMTVSDPAYLRDIARARFLYSVCLKAQGKTSQAITELIAALRIYNELCPGHQRTTAIINCSSVNENWNKDEVVLWKLQGVFIQANIKDLLWNLPCPSRLRSFRNGGTFQVACKAAISLSNYQPSNRDRALEKEKRHRFHGARHRMQTKSPCIWEDERQPQPQPS